jgi:tetratricopeptide (TPR) repeat protein
MPGTVAKTVGAFIILCGFCFAGAPLQESRPQGIVPGDLSPDTIQALPIDPSVRAHLQEAIRSRDYKLAEMLLATEVGRDPKNPALLTLLGRILFFNAKYLECAIAIKKAEALAPVDERSRFTLALSYIMLGRDAWARPEFEDLARSDPRDPLYPYWLGRIAYKAQDFKGAVVNFKQALSLDPNFVRAYDNLGLSYDALGQLDEAIDTYGKATSLNRRQKIPSPWPPLNLGSLLVRIGKLEEAQPLLQESLKYDPRFPKAHCALGLLWEKEKKNDDAIRELDEAVKFDPSYAEPHYILGRIYQRMGNVEGANNEWRIFQSLKKGESKDHPQ